MLIVDYIQEQMLITLAKEIPIVPVPQQMSSTVLSWLSCAHSLMAVYKTSAACVFTCENICQVGLLFYKQ